MASKEHLTVEALEDVLNSMMAEYEDVEHCRLVGVYWHEPDEDGTNWSCRLNCGNGVDRHSQEVADAVIQRARALYNLSA